MVDHSFHVHHFQDTTDVSLLILVDMIKAVEYPILSGLIAHQERCEFPSVVKMFKFIYHGDDPLRLI